MPIGNTGGGSGLGAVVLSGAAAAGQVIDATSSTAATWQFPPGYELSYQQVTTSTSITATTEAGATTIVTADAITFDGATVALVDFFSPQVTVPSGSEMVVVLYDGSSSIGFFGDVNATAGGANQTALRLTRRITPSNASHTYSVRAYRTTSNCTVFGGAGNTNGVYQPAFVRITKAA